MANVLSKLIFCVCNYCCCTICDKWQQEKETRVIYERIRMEGEMNELVEII